MFTHYVLSTRHRMVPTLCTAFTNLEDAFIYLANELRTAAHDWVYIYCDAAMNHYPYKSCTICQKTQYLDRYYKLVCCQDNAIMDLEPYVRKIIKYAHNPCRPYNDKLLRLNIWPYKSYDNMVNLDYVARRLKRYYLEQQYHPPRPKRHSHTAGEQSTLPAMIIQYNRHMHPQEHVNIFTYEEYDWYLEKYVEVEQVETFTEPQLRKRLTKHGWGQNGWIEHKMRARASTGWKQSTKCKKQYMIHKGHKDTVRQTKWESHRDLCHQIDKSMAAHGLFK